MFLYCHSANQWGTREEKKDLFEFIKHFLKGKKVYNELTLFLKIKKLDALLLELSKEEVVKNADHL